MISKCIVGQHRLFIIKCMKRKEAGVRRWHGRDFQISRVGHTIYWSRPQQGYVYIQSMYRLRAYPIVHQRVWIYSPLYACIRMQRWTRAYKHDQALSCRMRSIMHTAVAGNHATSRIKAHHTLQHVLKGLKINSFHIQTDEWRVQLMAKAERLAIMGATSDARTTKVAKKLTKVSRRKVRHVTWHILSVYVCMLGKASQNRVIRQ